MSAENEALRLARENAAINTPGPHPLLQDHNPSYNNITNT